MAQAGSIAARNELIEFLTPWIRSRCAVRGRVLEFFEDLVQPVTIAVMRSIETFDLSQEIQPLTYFAYRIRGEIADFYRNQLPPGARRSGSAAFGQHRTIRTDNFVEWVHPVDEIPELRREEFDSQDLIERIAESLGEREGQIVRWRFGQDLTMAEIAKRLGVSESLISLTMNRLLPVLRSKLESHLLEGRPLIPVPLKEPAMPGYDVDRELRSLFTPGPQPRPETKEDVMSHAMSRIPLEKPEENGARLPAATQTPREASAQTPARRLSARELATQLMATDAEDLEQFDREIELAERHLAKLKQARKVIASCIAGGKPKTNKGTVSIDGDLEKRIICWVERHGPAKPSKICEDFGLGFAAVGKTVKRSSRLGKDEAVRVVLT